ncbi:PQQ-binding-like beta-propeller repeat protein [Rhodovulum euryhalinum]|uniref:outer membrane protein assembly factor BamB family protein n=1 Tax=Rhodovulum euryhalinum TaxID=35805 RepID=UPI0014044B47|nr:PQQ-binding-like beta-propeller repeat protein [Rhodovulum euryhalinum]
MRLPRRSLLAAAPALLLSGRGAAAAQPLETVRDWRTGNAALGPPALDSGRLYFCGTRTAGCVSPGTGTPLWERPHGLPGPAVFRPRLQGDRVVVGGRAGIACLGREDGRELWRHVARIQTGVPAVDPDTVVFGDGHEIVARDLQSGAERWRFAAIPDTLASYAPCISGGRVFAGPGDGVLYCLDLATGRRVWAQERRGLWQYLRQIHAADGILVAGSYKEQLFGIAPDDGSILWQFVAGNFINSHHLAGDLACLWSPTGWIYAIDILSGAVRWRHQTTDYRPGGGDWASLMAELTSRAGLLYTLDMDDTLRLLDLASGDLRGQGRVPGRVRHAVLPVGDRRVVFPMTDGSLRMTRMPFAR